MFKIDRIGPWPIIDISATKGDRTDTLVETDIGAALDVCLDTANLGGNNEAFINNHFGAAGDIFSFSATGKQAAWGVALAPIDDYGSAPTYLQLAIKASYLEDNYEGKGTQICGFIGWLDGVAPSDGYSAASENECTNYCLIPGTGHDNDLSINTQILLKSITSASLETDTMLVAGFLIRAQAAQACYDLDYMISARYGYTNIPTNSQAS